MKSTQNPPADASADPPPKFSDPPMGRVPSKKLSGWADPVLLTRRGPDRTQRVYSWLTVVILVFLEAGILAPLLQALLNMGLFEAWAVSGAVAIVSAIAMHVAGRIRAGVGADRAGDSAVRVAALVGGWIALGGAITWIRVVGMATTTTTIEQTASSQGPKIEDWIAAGLFLVLYLISGLLAFNQGLDRNDVHEAHLLTSQRLQVTQAELISWQAQMTRVAREMQRRTADITHVQQFATHEIQRSEQLRDASMALVRSEIGRLKADPKVMGIASDKHPDHPGHTNAA